jgi:non-heme chloroperoxidase
MSTITTKDGTQIYYKDWGKGQPIVFSHGWPLSADDWDTQMLFFLNKGFRVIAHDRRGHGRSTQTDGGHDMDHYADDLAAAAKWRTTSRATAKAECQKRCSSARCHH